MQKHLVKGLHSGALDEVLIALGDAPVDLPIQLPRLWHAKVVHLAVEGVKEWVETGCDVPSPLQTCTGQGESPAVTLHIMSHLLLCRVRADALSLFILLCEESPSPRAWVRSQQSSISCPFFWAWLLDSMF